MAGNMHMSGLLVLYADVSKLQQPDGSFAGDAWGEIDTRCELNRKETAAAAIVHGMPWMLGIYIASRWSMRRFSYCALLCCRILDRMDAIDVSAAVDYVVACQNFDGGFGCTPGAALASWLRPFLA